MWETLFAAAIGTIQMEIYLTPGPFLFVLQFDIFNIDISKCTESMAYRYIWING